MTDIRHWESHVGIRVCTLSAFFWRTVHKSTVRAVMASLLSLLHWTLLLDITARMVSISNMNLSIYSLSTTLIRI